MRRGIGSTPNKSKAYYGRIEDRSTMWHIVKVLQATDESELDLNEILQRVREASGIQVPLKTLAATLVRHCKTNKYICHGSVRGRYGLVERLQKEENFTDEPQSDWYADEN